ncbi:uncharacterized protein LOC136718271 isoform X2 [Amia ocellicauda]|uniref:uncharacterized protein LOC136718271 isoform X2 n=1 Tax=Amia ocellicauda TaxID=2972642 RepID=UPI0034645B2B
MFGDNTRRCAAWIFLCAFLPSLKVIHPAQTLCNEGGSVNLAKVSGRTNMDVVVQCHFNNSLFKQGKKDVSVMWKYINGTTNISLVQIKLTGEVHFLNNKMGRMKIFQNLSPSGNFSIRLDDVQPEDFGLYRCELFRGSNCRLGYQDILINDAGQIQSWHFIAAGAGGGFIIILLIVVAAVLCKCKKRTANQSRSPDPDQSVDSIYANMSFHSENSTQAAREGDIKMDREQKPERPVTFYENRFHAPEYWKHLKRTPEPQQINQMELSSRSEPTKQPHKIKSNEKKKTKDQRDQYINPIYANSREQLNNLEE